MNRIQWKQELQNFIKEKFNQIFKNQPAYETIFFLKNKRNM